jgi:Uma2 family endonuclease
MSTTAPAATDQPAPEFRDGAGFRRFSVADYHELLRTGLLTHGEPYELLEGFIVRKPMRGTPHDAALDGIEGAILDLLPPAWFCRSQRAVTLPDSEPEPDLAVVRGPRSRYRDHHPGPDEIGLLVEVSDSSLRADRAGKARIYARAGIPVYWVVNIPDRKVEVFSQPSGPTESPAYGQRDEYPVGTAVPVVLDGNPVGTIAVADVMA